MSTHSIFMAGVKLASSVLGKQGPIEVDYVNWRSEPNREDPEPWEMSLKEAKKACQDHGISSRVTEAEMQKTVAENQVDPDDAELDVLQCRLNDWEDKNPPEPSLGRLFIGKEGESITYGDIEKFFNYLDEKDYYAHYPLVDVNYDPAKNRISLEWTT